MIPPAIFIVVSQDPIQQALYEQLKKAQPCLEFILVTTENSMPPSRRIAWEALVREVSEALSRAELAAAERMAMRPCDRCDGCGRIANSESGEPWTAWAELPLKSSTAVLIGLVRPIPCPDCNGTGVRS